MYNKKPWWNMAFLPLILGRMKINNLLSFRPEMTRPFLTENTLYELNTSNMNKKLAIEISHYLSDNMSGRVRYDETIEGFTTFEVGDIAEYFYNLALADVKDEIMRLVKINKELATRPFIEGIVAGYSDVLSVIKQLAN